MRTKYGWLGASLVMTVGVMTASSLAADGMRCGARLVSSGDTRHVVRSVCGEPDDAQRRVVTRTERRKVRRACLHDRAARCDVVAEVVTEVVVDEWTYDFGRNRLMRYLTFVDGKLARVETGSYGSQ